MPDVIEDLVKVYKGASPPDVWSSPLGLDLAYTCATVMALAQEECERLTNGAILGTATGLFADLHAKNLGLSRQDGETDGQLVPRLQNPPKAGTVGAIIEAVEVIVDTDTYGPVFLIELPRHAMFLSGTTPVNPYDIDYPFFHDRGHRMGGGRGVVIVLIPESADALASVRDAVRSKVSAGKLWLVEEYS